MNEWLGRVGGVSQVTTLTASGTGSGSGSIGITVGPKTVTVPVVAAQTAAQFAASAYALLAASAEPEVLEVGFTYTAGDAFVTATVRTPGNPVPIMAGGPITNNGITLTPATTKAATGPNDAANVKNWSLSALPSAGVLTMVRNGPDILFGIDTAFLNCDLLEIRSEWSGRRFGLPARNVSGGTASYSEYRVRRPILKAAATVRIGTGSGGAGPGFVGLDFAGAGANVYVLAAAATDPGEAGAVDIDTTQNLASLRVMGGTCQVKRDGGTGSLGAVRVTGGRLTVMNGAAFTSFTQDGGRTDMDATALAVPLVVNGGDLHITGGTQGNWTLTGGTIYVEFNQTSGTGSITINSTAVAGRAAPVVDVRNCPGVISIANGSTFKGGSKLLDPYGFATSPGSIVFDAASIAASDLGNNIPITRV